MPRQDMKGQEATDSAPVISALSRIAVSGAKKSELSTQSSQRRHRLTTDARHRARHASVFSSTVCGGAQTWGYPDR